MSMSNLEDAFMDELRDILGAEKQILKALPQMARKADNPELAEAFETHRQQTEEQIARLEQAFELLDTKPRGKKCEGMEGIISEGKEMMSEAEEPDVRDAVMIAAAQKVEHYEISSYGTIITWGEQIGCNRDVLKLLKQNLAEEKETDTLLTKLAKQKVNREAATAE